MTAMRDYAITFTTLVFAVSSVSAATLQQSPGTTGTATDFAATGSTEVAVDGSVEFWVDFGDLAISVPDSDTPFVYTASADWNMVQDLAGISVSEIVRGAGGEEGNLSAFGIIPNVAATGVSSGASFPALPFDVVSYHMEITGLTSGDTVEFSKIGSGGEVKAVPEPAFDLSSFAILVLAALRARRCRSLS